MHTLSAVTGFRKKLNTLFEGVHFNCSTKVVSNAKELAYFATAPNYVWNPHDWDAVESCK